MKQLSAAAAAAEAFSAAGLIVVESEAGVIVAVG